MASITRRKRVLYLVKWLGFPRKKDWTYEPYENFSEGAHDKLHALHEKNPSAPRDYRLQDPAPSLGGPERQGPASRRAGKAKTRLGARPGFTAGRTRTRDRATHVLAEERKGTGPATGKDGTGFGLRAGRLKDKDRRPTGLLAPGANGRQETG